MKNKLAVLIPALNEEKNIREVIRGGSGKPSPVKSW